MQQINGNGNHSYEIGQVQCHTARNACMPTRVQKNNDNTRNNIFFHISVSTAHDN